MSRGPSNSLYWINVREQWGDDGSPIFRLFNHNAPAGGRLFKGYGPQQKPVQWPFAEGEEWLKHGSEGDANEAARKLQKYLDQIASK